MGFLIKLKGKEIQNIEFFLETAVENIIEGIKRLKGVLA